VSLARFYPRIHDAIRPLLTEADDLESFLSSKIVCLEAPDNLEQHPVHLAGFLLAANLCARLYPRIRLLGAEGVVRQCQSLIHQINPLCEVQVGPGLCHASLGWVVTPKQEPAVAIAPSGWDVHLNSNSSELQPSNILTSLAAAALGVGEIFCSVFAPFLHSRRLPSSAERLNLLTLDNSSLDLPPLPSDIDIGKIHLAGAGAIGQAAIYTLARVSVKGTIVVVDPETVTLSNLQRYVLTTDKDVDASKCALITRALKGSSLRPICIEHRWEDLDLSQHGPFEVVCAAVDTAAVRMGIQAGLPKRIYNAWTQPADLGWSRHEKFGVDPCLACLYWPNQRRPSDHQLIARATRQAELRVLGYLTFCPPIDQPLQSDQIPQVPDLPLPLNASGWTKRSILDDILTALKIDGENRKLWQGKQLRDLYREGICGGALISAEVGEVTQDIAVPLAHQSVFAGIMLAAQLLIASTPELRPFRSNSIENRFNVLSDFSQTIQRPRQRTSNCICTDPDFVERYRAKWHV
jgi:hypothetical protein